MIGKCGISKNIMMTNLIPCLQSASPQGILSKTLWKVEKPCQFCQLTLIEIIEIKTLTKTTKTLQV